MTRSENTQYKKAENCPDWVLVFQDLKGETYLYTTEPDFDLFAGDVFTREARKGFAKQLFKMRYDMSLPEYDIQKNKDFTDEDLLEYFMDMMEERDVDEIIEDVCPNYTWPFEYGIVTEVKVHNERQTRQIDTITTADQAWKRAEYGQWCHDAR